MNSFDRPASPHNLPHPFWDGRGAVMLQLAETLRIERANPLASTVLPPQLVGQSWLSLLHCHSQQAARVLVHATQPDSWTAEAPLEWNTASTHLMRLQTRLCRTETGYLVLATVPIDDVFRMLFTLQETTRAWAESIRLRP